MKLKQIDEQFYALECEMRKALNPFASQIRVINGKDIHDMTHEEQLGMLRLIVAVCEVHRLHIRPELKQLPKEQPSDHSRAD